MVGLRTHFVFLESWLNALQVAKSDLWVGLSYEMYIIWMVNLAEIDKQMAEALLQLLNVKQSREKTEATSYTKPRDAQLE